MGKLVSWIALAFFVVVVPFISWYYLKLGYNYRKQILAEVKVKDSIDILLDSIDVFKAKTTVLILKRTDKSNNLSKGLLEQFKNMNGFQVASYDSLSTNTTIVPNTYLTNLQSKYQGNSVLLIDTSLRIRNAYNDDPASIKKLIEHIAVILPRQKEADIKMKK